jgi:hypothetical protein
VWHARPATTVSQSTCKLAALSRPPPSPPIVSRQSQIEFRPRPGSALFARAPSSLRSATIPAPQPLVGAVAPLRNAHPDSSAARLAGRLRVKNMQSEPGRARCELPARAVADVSEFTSHRRRRCLSVADRQRSSHCSSATSADISLSLACLEAACTLPRRGQLHVVEWPRLVRRGCPMKGHTESSVPRSAPGVVSRFEWSARLAASTTADKPPRPNLSGR